MPQTAPLEYTIYNQNGTRIWTLGDQVQGAVIETVCPGGCSEFRCTLTRPVRLDYPDIQYPYDLRISDGESVFWRGRIERWRGQLLARSESIEVSALQVNADDQLYTSKTFSAGTAIETCVSTVRTDLMPKVTAESLVTTGRSLVADLVVTGQRARTVLDTLRKFGTSGNVELFWFIWPDGDSSGAYQLVLSARPSSPAYWCMIEHFQGDIGFDGSLYANQVRTLYNGGASWSTLQQDTTAQSTAGVGLIREAPPIEMPDITNATDAANVAATALNTYKQLRVTAEGGQIAFPWAIKNTGTATTAEQIVPLWRVRAGGLLEVRGMYPQGAAGSYDWRNTVLIRKTSYAVDAGVLTLTFEDLGSTQEGVIARLKVATEI